MSNTFKAYMKANYTHNEMAEIAQHGCESGCAGGMIYHSQTVSLFDQYRDDLFSMMADYQESTGDFESLPAYVRTNSETFTSFANAVVWFCAELVAMYETDGAYIEEAAS